MIARVLLALVALYRRWLSRWLGGHCRFLPTCSVYAEQCLTQFGALRGGWLSLARLLRCHPFCQGGYDPPPMPSVESGSGTALPAPPEQALIQED